MMKTLLKGLVVCSTLSVGTGITSPPAFAQETAKQAYDKAAPQESLKKMSAVDKLLAIEEIKQLPLRYGRCISQKDWDCVRELFAPDFVMSAGSHQTPGADGFIQVMHDAGTYDRVFTVLHIHGHEVEILSPTTARGIAAADFTFYYPPGQSFPTTGKEVVAPGQQTNTSTYYYQTYEKVDGKWKIRTLDHVSFDLRTDHSPYTVIMPNAYVTPDGVPPYKR
jgi:SnoaL-like domain